jgi:MFS family permease
MNSTTEGSAMVESTAGGSRRGVLLALLTLTAAAGVYARFTVGPLQESMRVALGLSDNQMALLQGPALALPVVFAAVPLGILIDRYSRMRLLCIFAICNVGGTLLTAMATDFYLLLAARAVVGLTAAATPIATYSLLADLFPAGQRGRANMVMAVGQAGAHSAVFALGGALLTMSVMGEDSWRWALTWMSAPLVLIPVVTLLMREPGRTGSVVRKPSARQACLELWRFRKVIAPLLAGVVVLEIAVGAAITWTAPALSRNFALPPARVGTIMALMFLISGIAGPIAGGLLADFCHRAGGPRRTVTVLGVLTLLGAPAGLFPVAPTISLAFVLLLALYGIVNAIAVAATTVSTVVIPNELRGLFLAVLSVFGSIFAFVLAPLTVSLLSGLWGGTQALGAALAAVCVATCLAGAVLFVAGRSNFPGPVSRAE